MKLEGSLDAFGLPDIFQLLSLTKKTGGLHLRNGAMVGVVHFAEGAVTGADADLARQTLARRLVGSMAVSEDALASAVKRARHDGIGVGRALLDAGAVDAGLVREAAAEVAYDAVFELLGWPEGEFAFSPDAVNPDDVGVHLPTEQVVTAARSRQQALDSAADVIDSPAQVLSMTAIVDTDPELSRAEWALVALADGRRTVTEIVDLTGQSYYSVVEHLAALVRRGLLDVGGPDHLEAVARRIDVLTTLEGGADGGADGSANVGGDAQRDQGRPSAAPAAPVASGTGSAANGGDQGGRNGGQSAVVAAQTETAEKADTVVDRKTVPAMSTPQPQQVQSAPAFPVEPAPDGAFAVAQDLAIEHDLVSTVGGPHVPDGVVPPRPEPFLARRQVDHPERDKPRDPAGSGSAAAAPVTARATSSPLFSQPSGSPVAHTSSAASAGVGSAGGAAAVGGVNGSAAMAADPETSALIERDPSVNRSLLLRLIAGVRGL